MDEKYMVNDILEGSKSSLKTYAGVITNSQETFQYDLYRVANLKGYYTPSAQATQTEINQVKTEVQS